RARVEHPVVVREIVRRNEIEAGVALQPPVRGAQAGAGREQVRAGDLAAPVALGGALQLAIGAKGREAETVGDGHRTGNLSWAEGRRKRPRRIDSLDPARD